MRRALLILACAVLILLGSMAAGPGKTTPVVAVPANPMHYPVPAHVDISGIFLGR